jgi:hypothetical protein
MILINLLPTEFRVREKTKYEIPYKLIAISGFVLFLLLSLYNLFLFVRIREEQRALKGQWEHLARPSAEADMLQRELGMQVVAEIDFYDTFVDPDLEVARVLNLVSDLIPKSLTLVDLQFVRKAREFKLMLRGISESPSQDSKLIEIQNYVNGLKDQLEEFLARSLDDQPSPVPGLPGAKKRGAASKGPNIKVVVETSSKQKSSVKKVITQFEATLETEGFDDKKDAGQMNQR